MNKIRIDKGRRGGLGTLSVEIYIARYSSPPPPLSSSLLTHPTTRNIIKTGQKTNKKGVFCMKETITKTTRKITHDEEGRIIKETIVVKTTEEDK
jgi:hypothetical protein